MSVVLHPKWVEGAGIGDITRHLQTRGFVVTQALGSKFFHAVPAEHLRELGRTLLQQIADTFKSQPQRR